MILTKRAAKTVNMQATWRMFDQRCPAEQCFYHAARVGNWLICAGGHRMMRLPPHSRAPDAAVGHRCLFLRDIHTLADALGLSLQIKARPTEKTEEEGCDHHERHRDPAGRAMTKRFGRYVAIPDGIGTAAVLDRTTDEPVVSGLPGNEAEQLARAWNRTESEDA